MCTLVLTVLAPDDTLSTQSNNAAIDQESGAASENLKPGGFHINTGQQNT